MHFIERQKFNAKRMQKNLVLPEGNEPRTLKAARVVIDEEIAKKVILLGDKKEIEEVAFSHGVKLDGFTIVDPKNSSDNERYAEEFTELRKAKGMTMEKAREEMKNCLKYGAMMTRLGDADAMVAGALHTTADVLLAGFTIIKTAPGVKSASSCFIMDVPNKSFGAEGLLIFTDCATIIEPTSEQLAEIAIAASDSCKKYLDVEPITAMLSFSTNGSASHEKVDRVVNALKIAKELRPDLNIDGEMQLDAAIIPEVAKKKAPSSPVAGKANVLVFPDLQSGNIGYKLVQRFSGAGAYGPFMQGFAKPISDLSRGATIEDIINTCAVVLASAK